MKCSEYTEVIPHINHVIVLLYLEKRIQSLLFKVEGMLSVNYHNAFLPALLEFKTSSHKAMYKDLVLPVEQVLLSVLIMAIRMDILNSIFTLYAPRSHAVSNF